MLPEPIPVLPAARRIPELDGIRGLAILLVLGFHLQAYLGSAGWLHRAFALGWCGVDLFFALSGFLITGVLLDSAGIAHRARTFYTRRSLRILPLYYAFIALYFGAAALRGKPDPLAAQAWYWLHLSNWQSAFNPLQYPSLSVFWSLAIEEQFYLVWPLVVWTLSPRALFRACIGGALACMAFRNFSAAQAMETVYPLSLYRLTPFHVDGLLLGSLCALIYRKPDLRAAAKPYVGWFALFATAAFLAIAWFAQNHSQWMSRLGYAAIALAGASLVLFAALHSPSIFRAPFLRGFGKYSYCIYVIHTAVYAHVLWPLQKALGGGEAAGVVAGAMCIAAIYLAAASSWKLFEKRFLDLSFLGSPAGEVRGKLHRGVRSA